MVKNNLTIALLFLLTSSTIQGQGNIHPQSQEYQCPSDSLVLEKLEKWRDMKFGIIIHWGIYSVPGIIESWSICSEDWIYRDSTISYGDYKKWYFDLKNDFNPTNFSPDQWARAAKSAGMRYMVFTTKHHDGFCMWNTQRTDFKITDGPFANNARADVASYVFEAFRDKDFMIGAYFSKPDWHCEYYWWQRYATPNRNNNYNIHQHPWRWQQYINYTHAQINELMSEYGPIDILWLDGGWVRPRETVNQEVLSWGAPIPEWSQDIQMDKIASNSREKQPGLLIVDRTVHGPYENYQTPEQQIPDAVLDNPWESCITLGNNWGYVPGDQFKKPSLIVHKLIEVVAKGGNLLLGMGPDSKGEFSQEQINKLDSIGDWLEKNSEAIYSTRTLPDYQYENIFFTRSKDNQKHYALVCIPVDGSVPEKVIWKGNLPKSGSTMILLATGETVKWRRTGYSIEVSIPAQYRKKNTHTPALTFSFTPEYEL